MKINIKALSAILALTMPGYTTSMAQVTLPSGFEKLDK